MRKLNRIGIGFRRPLTRWILGKPDLVQCLEITAEHFFDSDRALLSRLGDAFPLYVHGLGLSLGTPGELDRETLTQFRDVASVAKAEWVSDHIAFTRSSEIDLGHLNPVPRTQAMIDVLARHATELRELCARPVLLENITAHLDPGGDLTEPDFLNRLCEAGGCGLLLDVTNIFINSRNHGFDARAWLRRLNPENIIQLHVVGYHRVNGVYQDHHGAVIQEDLMELVAEVLDYGTVQAVILERDQNLERLDEIENDLGRLRALVKP